MKKFTSNKFVFVLDKKYSAAHRSVEGVSTTFWFLRENDKQNKC